MVKFLSSRKYADPNFNHGDCILIDTGTELIVFDCGSEAHAKRVLDYAKQNGYQELSIILSHNDDDHFNGIPTLLDSIKVKAIYTHLLLKYKDDILDRINDQRRNRHSIGESIVNAYSNIASLSGCNLKDAFVDKRVAIGVQIVGPDKDYVLDAVAKGIDSRQGENIDKETITNATSLHVSVQLGSQKLLLCGDSAFAPLEEILPNYIHVQLPHHGKPEMAEKIFEANGNRNVRYYISDNTGNSNGGCQNNRYPGHYVRNTLFNGDFVCEEYTTNLGHGLKPIGSLG